MPSRPEWAIYGGAAVILASILIPAAWAFDLHRQARRAREDLLALVDAANRFNVEYGQWPVGRGVRLGDVRFGQEVPNWELVNALRAVDGPGNLNHAANPHRVVFLEVRAYKTGSSGADPNGEFLDPWGRPYQIAVDADGNGVCVIEDTVHGAGVGRGVIAWSCGPDRRSDTPDDILSWTAKDRVKPIGPIPAPPGPPRSLPYY